MPGPKPGNITKQGTWTTEDEKKFIKGVGTFAPGRAEGDMAREMLLQNYIVFMSEVRHNFGRINKGEVIAYAQEELAKLRGMGMACNG
jgi:hypothetical protein